MKPRTKTCTGCGKTKTLRLFDRHGRGRHGRFSKCSDCTSEMAARNRLANPDKYRSRNGSINNLYSVLKSKCKAAQREFTLTLEEFSVLRAQPCYYSGHSLPKFGGGLDRIDSRRGYSIDNVRPCCARCNAMKGEMTEEEFVLQMEIILARLK